MSNPVHAALELGQSFWLDSLSRKLLVSGEFRRLVEEVGLTGVTSNPSIFEKAMVGSGDYVAELRSLVGNGMCDAKALYESLAISDIRAAADLLHPTYVRTQGSDGFASLEVSPHLAHSTEGTVAEGRRLFREVDRENVMIKVPGTPAGMPAIERLIGEGVNVNVTLLFGLDAYRACAEAHVRGIERLDASGADLGRVSGVASFFLSRIDTLVDQQIDAAQAKHPSAQLKQQLDGLRGQIAIANAKLAYAHFHELTASARWGALASRGARPQRLLWASTGTKNPAYPPTMYVDALIGADTVNTLPVDTLTAFIQRGGQPQPTLAHGTAHAVRVMSTLAATGISLGQVTAELLEKGIAQFASSFDKLNDALDRERHRLASAEASASASP